MATVFLSYSREDATFVERLHSALVVAGQDVWLDAERIPPRADWRTTIERGIEESDAFAFVITPDSLASEVCRYEFDHALAHGKRIVPLLHRDVQSGGIPAALASRNWILLRSAEELDAALPGLVAAINGR
jgi:hypothetical protein